MGGLTVITDLEALTTNHTNDITALETLTNGLVVSDITTNATNITALETLTNGLNVSDITTNATNITALETLTNGLNVSDITTNTTDISNIEADNLVKNIALNGFSYDTTISAGNVQQWAYDVSDGNVIVTTHDGANTRFVKITLDGNLVMDIGGVGNRGKYILALLKKKPRAQ